MHTQDCVGLKCNKANLVKLCILIVLLYSDSSARTLYKNVVLDLHKLEKVSSAEEFLNCRLRINGREF